jgi:hypothetical protein
LFSIPVCLVYIGSKEIKSFLVAKLAAAISIKKAFDDYQKLVGRTTEQDGLILNPRKRSLTFLLASSLPKAWKLKHCRQSGCFAFIYRMIELLLTLYNSSRLVLHLHVSKHTSKSGSGMSFLFLSSTYTR